MNTRLGTRRTLIVLWLAAGLLGVLADGATAREPHRGRHDGSRWDHGGYRRDYDHSRRYRSDDSWSAPAYAWPESSYESSYDHPDYYAAIAYSSSTGGYGYSYGYTSLSAAQNEAVRRCATADAQVVAWSRDAWCALALGDGLGAYGWSWATNRLSARGRALAECGSRTTNCYVAVCVFSGD